MGNRTRFALTIGVVALISGCGGSQSPIAASGAMPQSRMIAAHAEHGGSWMLPEAKSEDLLYVATGNNVYVLSYPHGKVIGSLDVSGDNLCSNKDGDVFIPTSGYVVLEYPHGGTSPIQTLNDGDVPLGCAVDPITGNLAVTNEASGAGEVAIFPNAKAPSTWYRDPDIYTYGLCGYDNQGNLFLDGTGTANFFAELPKGSAAFTNYALSDKFDAFGSVQWDGTYITLTNPSAHEIFRLNPSTSSLKIVSTTRVHGWQNAYSGHWPYLQTWLQGDTFIAQASTLAAIGLWPYPAGGKPSNVLSAFTSGTVNIYGLTVSLARH